MGLLFFDALANGTMPKPEYVSGGTAAGPGGRTAGTGTLNTGTIAVSPGSALVTVGGAIRFVTGNPALGFLTFRSGGVAHVVVNVTAPTGATGPGIEVRLATSSGTLLASMAPGAIPWNEWHHLQVQASIADTGGRVLVKVDEVTVIDFTGDTRNGGTTTTVDQIAFAGNVTNGGANTIISDLWIADDVDATATQGRPNRSFLGDLKCAVLLPSGDGATNQFLGSDGNSVQNHLLVDDPGTPNTTDYVGSATVGQRDLYALNDLPVGAGSVYAIRQAVYAAKSDTGAIGGKMLLRDAAGTVTDDAVISPALSTTFGIRHAPMRCLKPAGGTWALADVNALQIGTEVTAS